ncbi:hypothetical protein XELAEV_18020591mg [Xenopus laevis]|uniref:Uncharacterized protein n=1 Tax=Xenopus laevis TaxID=8355 RepID=A0A974D9Y9_XENLA|nr:hypothetical protein XELAEV_18020591mg [Xenopus laevis]
MTHLYCTVRLYVDVAALVCFLIYEVSFAIESRRRIRSIERHSREIFKLFLIGDGPVLLLLDLNVFFEASGSTRNCYAMCWKAH